MRHGTSKGYNLPKQFYDDMAWGGLTDTNAFKKLKGRDRVRIKDVIATEHNGTDRNGNPRSQKAKKAGC